MQIGYIEGATRVVGKSQGYFGLPIRDGEINCSVNGPGTPEMRSVWVPLPHELEALTAGAAVILCVQGTDHPPVMLGVGEPPKDDIPLVDEKA